MKRTAFKLSVFLLLGAVTTVAVAWGCAAWSDVSTGLPTKRAASTAELHRLKSVGWAPRQPTEHWDYEYWIVETRVFGLSDRWIVEEVKRGNLTGSFYLEFHVATVTRAGWPMRCLSWNLVDPVGNGWGGSTFFWSLTHRLWRSTAATPADGREETPIEDWRRSMALELPAEIGFISLPDERLVPLQPLWLGFAFNTAIYGLAGWLVFSILSGRRRLLRFVRGRCPHCGYDRRGDYTRECSECGWKRKGADAA